LGVGRYCSRDLGGLTSEMVSVDLGVGGYCSWDLGALTLWYLGVWWGELGTRGSGIVVGTWELEDILVGTWVCW